MVPFSSPPSAARPRRRETRCCVHLRPATARSSTGMRRSARTSPRSKAIAPSRPLGNRLAGAHRHACLLLARHAQLRIAEDHMIGKPGHGLHLAAHQQRILLRHQQPAVELESPASRARSSAHRAADAPSSPRAPAAPLPSASRPRSSPRSGRICSAPAESAHPARAARASARPAPCRSGRAPCRRWNPIARVLRLLAPRAPPSLRAAALS